MEINITTNQNVLINYKLCSLGDRIVAYLIDGLIIIGLSIIFGIIGAAFGRMNPRGFGFINLVFMIPILFYHFICELTMEGQSVGKRARDIKVMKASGSEATFSSYFLRFLLRPIDSIYALGLVFIFFTEKNQRLGDLAAGTVIVKIDEPVTLEKLNENITTNDVTEITYPQVAELKDKDITLIKSILSKRKYDRNHENIILLASKIKKVLSVTSGLPDYEFLQKIVTDFNAYYSR